MTGTFISLHETRESRFHTIIEGELTFDGAQITIFAPDLFKGITVAAERFMHLKEHDKKALDGLGIRPMPQIVKGEKINTLRQYLNSRQPAAGMA